MKNVRVFVILNPNSRRFVFSKLQKNLSKFLTNHTIIYKKTDYPSHATKILSELNFKDYDFIICVGGDGTINEVINGMNLMKTTPLAIIPFGTANVLSYELGINSSFNRSLKTIKENRILKSYFGIAGSKKFLSMLGVGFDAYVISKIDLKLKKRYGKLIYFYETIKSL